MVGNFIADSIKGNPFNQYDKEIAIGIRMHREIDTFTDNHYIVKESKARLYSNYGKYSPVIVDIFYDYFLAKNWSIYESVKLTDFAKRTYEVLGNNREIFPNQANRFYQYMTKFDILSAYASMEGIQKVLNGMASRAKFHSNMDKATYELERFEAEFEAEFKLFFPEIKNHLSERYSL